MLRHLACHMDRHTIESNPMPAHMLNAPIFPIMRLISGNMILYYSGLEALAMQSAPPMKKRIEETMFKNAPISTEITMKRRATRIMRIPTPFDDGFLQKNEAIMQISGPPKTTAGNQPALTCPFDAADITPAHMDAQRLLGKDSTKAIGPSIMGIPVLGFRIIVSPLMVFLLLVP